MVPDVVSVEGVVVTSAVVVVSDAFIVVVSVVDGEPVVVSGST